MSSKQLSSPMQLPLTGSALIEASAGTGKTYTIAALYVRFILAHIDSKNASAVRPEPLLPPNILVVTFTKAATAELKDRIRRRLVESAHWFRQSVGGSSGDPVLDALRDSYAEEKWAACAQALQVASEWMDEASVKTIHSWCQTLLREHAFSSGSLFSQELTTELSQFKLDAARDYWRNFVYPLREQDYLAVAAVANSPESLLSLIYSVWGQVADGQPEPIDITALRGQKQADYERAVGEAYQAWQQYLPALYDYVDKADASGWLTNKRKLSSKLVRTRMHAIESWLELDEKEALNALPPVSDALVTNYSSAGFAELISQPVTDLPFLDQTAALAELAKGAAGIREELLSHAAQWVKQRFSEKLQQLALMGFDDIIEQCRKALQRDTGDTLADLVRTQYPVAMIDEFQDTDPDQYAIFNAVYQLRQQREDVAVYLIGDPKQAIYAFRGADIFTYLQARRDTEGRHFTLARNFRSTSSMVEASNQIFLAAEEHQPKKAFLFNGERNGKRDNEVPFVAVEAQGQTSHLLIDGQPAEKALTLWTSLNSQNEQKALSKEAYGTTQAESCASYIVHLLNSASQGQSGIEDKAKGFRPLRSADMAVLVNSRVQGYMVQQSLRRRGVASVFLSDRNSVFDTAVAKDVLSILHACAHPGQRQALTNALYTGLLAVPLEELERLQHDDLAWDRRVEQCYQLAQVWQQQGVLAMLHQLIHDFDIASRLLAQVGGERDTTDLLHLAELLQQAASRLDGEQALLRYLQDKIYQSDDDGADEQTVRLESDSELVQIVTVHKSKGLEYPLVFLPFSSDSKPISKKRPVVHFHDDDGRRLHSSKPTEEQLARADEERLGEEIRHLYVALTRSKYACWASLAPVSEWQKSALAYLALADQADASDANMLLQQAAKTWGKSDAVALMAQPEASSEPWQAPAAEISAPSYCRMPSNHRFEPWWIASYSALKYGALREPETALEANLLEDADDPEGTGSLAGLVQPGSDQRHVQIHDLPRGAGPGTFLHNLFEDAAELGFANVAQNADVRAALLDKRCRHGQWKERRQQLDGWLQQYLQLEFPLPSTSAPTNAPASAASSVRLADLTAYKAEPEFWFGVRGVSAERLDNLVSKHVLSEFARPALQPNYLNGMLKGFIDLVFEHEGRYYVADYKSNYLGADDSAYTDEAMREKILGSRYDMQYVLYSLALHKLLKTRLGDGYDYDSHVGGVLYLFLRGHNALSRGAFTDKPSRELIEELEQYLLAVNETEPTL
ncbi:exodeoxyribonuclease V subunit beta [Aliidiomarina sedimenti]|uniref:RecBCD enzyme subunit RecB n=2 Tax=Aliidiomarina sedimenti TaxID=1933879 RepID=A0ABY0C4R2_9GAMM|nr:exodeoxyribonuclease V subunit beta [Aliidiomarina sedimenti]